MGKGDGSFQYDYDAMWRAYEEMMHVNKRINDGATHMHEQAGRVLQVASGDTRDGYEMKFRDLQQVLADLNQMMGGKANTMQDLFDNMQRMDGKLGGGF